MILEYIIWIFVLAFLTLMTYFDETTKRIPNLPVFIAFTVGVLIKIWHSAMGDNWLIFATIQIGLILAVLLVPEKYIGGGDLKIFAAFYALIPDYVILLFFIFLSYLIASIDSVIKKKKHLLFARYMLISYILIFLFFIF